MSHTTSPSLGKTHSPVERTAKDNFWLLQVTAYPHSSKVAPAPPPEDQALAFRKCLKAVPGTPRAEHFYLLGPGLRASHTRLSGLATIFVPSNACHHLPLSIVGDTGPESLSHGLKVTQLESDRAGIRTYAYLPVSTQPPSPPPPPTNNTATTANTA